MGVVAVLEQAAREAQPSSAENAEQVTVEPSSRRTNASNGAELQRTSSAPAVSRVRPSKTKSTCAPTPVPLAEALSALSWRVRRSSTASTSPLHQ